MDGTPEYVGAGSAGPTASERQFAPIAMRVASAAAEDQWASIEPDVLLPVEEVGRCLTLHRR